MSLLGITIWYGNGSVRRATTLAEWCALPVGHTGLGDAADVRGVQVVQRYDTATIGIDPPWTTRHVREQVCMMDWYWLDAAGVLHGTTSVDEVIAALPGMVAGQLKVGRLLLDSDWQAVYNAANDNWAESGLPGT